MKDLIFKNQSGTVNVTYKIDSFEKAGAATGHFTILDIVGLPKSQDSSTKLSNRDLLLIATFKKVVTNFDACIKFAIKNKLSLILQGQGSITTLVGNYSDSTSDSFS